MKEIVLLTLILLGYVVVMTNSKIQFLNIRKRAVKLKAQVIEYRKEKGPIRNDYTMLQYPYVKVLSDGPDQGKIRRLRYANNWSKPFRVGELVDVFWSGGELLYWNAMDKGIQKYLPGSLPWR